MTAASRPLIARAFATEDLPAVRLPGSEEPAAISRVLGAVDPRQEGDDPLTPLVGREREVELLLDRYRLACSGTGQAVMISGEPGIGKSRLLKDLREHLAVPVMPEGSPSWWIAYGSLSDQGSPLADVRSMGFNPSRADAQRFVVSGARSMMFLAPPTPRPQSPRSIRASRTRRSSAGCPRRSVSVSAAS